MNRTDLIAVAVTAVIGALVLFENTQTGRETSAVDLIMSRDSVEMLDASYNLAYHSRMVVVESLVIAKKSINLALDSAIESI